VTTTAPAPPAEPGNAFELCGPLPHGTTVLEASAGTGKTYAIVGLAVRYVAEAGVDISRLLLVTFSRAATQELRMRTRDRFVAVAAALADPEAARTASDELIRHLADAEPEEVRARRTRLRAALSDFDAGVIATTHSFCQRMLAELGLAGDLEPGARLVEEADDLIRTVVDDLYLNRFARVAAPFSVKQAQRACRSRPIPTRRRRSGSPSRPRSVPKPNAGNDWRGYGTSTICWCCCAIFSPTRRAVRPRAVVSGTATRWCSSTNSRTPIRCSGRSCAGPSTATPRWSWWATRNRRSTRSGAPRC
jgi:hypothetical protein